MDGFYTDAGLFCPSPRFETSLDKSWINSSKRAIHVRLQRPAWANGNIFTEQADRTVRVAHVKFSNDDWVALGVSRSRYTKPLSLANRITRPGPSSLLGLVLDLVPWELSKIILYLLC